MAQERRTVNTARRTVRLATLGCKVNQYETQYARELLEAAGWVEAQEGESADLCVVNTCTVTHEGDAKGRQLIRKLHHKNPQAAIVVMGCYATRDPDAVATLPGVSHVIADKERLVEKLAPYGVTGALPGISRFDGHQRAFVKVQDGCLLHCSYCIIPTVRPGLRSRPVDAIVDEVRRLVEESGYPEVVLTGIHLGHYGIDLSRGRPRDEWSRLWHLLERLAALPGDFRIRLSSLEAAEAREDLLRVLRDCPRIVPHLHLCLQSGSNAVLRKMKRRYSREDYLTSVRRVRDLLDAPALTTDVIVGFPGETEADFLATLGVVREAGFAGVHLFGYSPREGTPAARLPETVPPPVLAERRERLRELAEQEGQRYRRSLIGRTLDVLVETADTERPGHVRGTSCRHVPVSLRGHLPALRRKRVPVRITDLAGDVLLGDPLPGSIAEPSSVPHPLRWQLPLIG
jgi:threonylcarbamoyladenosine tRNA methylthiotransferase MtaB